MVLRNKLIALLALLTATAAGAAVVTTRHGPSSFDGILLLPSSISAEPSLGVCDADREPAISYARDTDGGAGVLCYCRYTGSGWAWAPVEPGHGSCP